MGEYSDTEARAILEANQVTIMEDTDSPAAIVERLASMGKLELPTEIGAAAMTTEYVFIGIEGTAESTREDRQKMAEEGISSHPVGWGVAYYRRQNRDS